MGWKKLDFVTQAFEEIGYASYIYDAMPEQLESVRRTLDAMMATWNAKGIRVGYPIASSPDGGSLNDETGVPDSANEAIYLNLACRIAPRFGKAVQEETRKFAKEAYDSLLIKLAHPLEMQLPSSMPSGAGNKRKRPFLDGPIDPLLAGRDDEIAFT